LRILNGQDKPISIIDIKGRMLDRMSNVSRLVEKLRVKGFVDRVECPTDRRLVEINITDKGRKFLKTITEAMPEHLHFRAALDDEQALLLSDLLDQMRSASPQPDFEQTEG
jgi:DNA-binding MarR family transcriptional regulator